MKRIIILLFPVLFYGCEKYAQPTDIMIKVDGDRIITGVITSFTSNPPVKLETNPDLYALSSCCVIGRTPEGVLILRTEVQKQLEPCFVFGLGYVWEFNNRTLNIKDASGRMKGNYQVCLTDNYGQFTLINKDTNKQINGFYFKNIIGPDVAKPANGLQIQLPTYFPAITSGEKLIVRQDYILTF